MPDPDKPKKIFICKKNIYFSIFFFQFVSISPSYICLKILSLKTAKTLIS